MRHGSPAGPEVSPPCPAPPERGRDSMEFVATGDRPCTHLCARSVRRNFPWSVSIRISTPPPRAQGPRGPSRQCRKAATAMAYVNTPQGMPETAPAAQRARERLARLLHAQPDDIVWTSNTTHGLNIVAQGIDWRPGDNCVVPAGEFPSLAYAWAIYGRAGWTSGWCPGRAPAPPSPSCWRRWQAETPLWSPSASGRPRQRLSSAPGTLPANGQAPEATLPTVPVGWCPLPQVAMTQRSHAQGMWWSHWLASEL
jgi:hypothetical protein